MRANRAVLVMLAAVGGMFGAAATPGLAAGSEGKPGEIRSYDCQSGQVIVVRYDDATAGSPGIELQYAGKSFDMFSVASDTGARFSTEQGLTPDHGLQWWSDDDQATLSEMLMDHTAPAPSVIETCSLRSDVAMDSTTSSAELLGTWRATVIGGQPVDPEVETRITFNVDGSVNGNGGCNNFGGKANLAGGGLGIEDVFSTRMACEGAGSTQENAFLAALEGTTAYGIDHGNLILLDASGGEAARLEPSESPD